MERESELAGSDKFEQRLFDSVGLRRRRVEKARLDRFVADAAFGPDVSGSLLVSLRLREGRRRHGVTTST
jgi:hypothetical protein